MARRVLVRVGLGAAASVALAGAARADASPLAIVGDPVVAIGIVVVLIAIIWLVIRGALSLTRGEKDDDDAGVGVLEGIDEDEEKPRK